MAALGSTGAVQMQFLEPEQCQAQPVGSIPASPPPGHSRKSLSAPGIYCTVLSEV